MSPWGILRSIVRTWRLEPPRPGTHISVGFPQRKLHALPIVQQMRHNPSLPACCTQSSPYHLPANHPRAQPPHMYKPVHAKVTLSCDTPCHSTRPPCTSPLPGIRERGHAAGQGEHSRTQYVLGQVEDGRRHARLVLFAGGLSVAKRGKCSGDVLWGKTRGIQFQTFFVRS